MRERIRRIQVEHLLEQGDGLSQLLAGALVPMMATFQVKVVRIHARGRLLDRRQGALQELGAERNRDGAGELVLDGEDVVELSIVRLRPEVIAVRGIDELRHDSQLATLAADAPFQHRADGELLGDLEDAQVLAFEGER